MILSSFEIFGRGNLGGFALQHTLNFNDIILRMEKEIDFPVDLDVPINGYLVHLAFLWHDF